MCRQFDIQPPDKPVFRNQVGVVLNITYPLTWCRLNNGGKQLFLSSILYDFGEKCDGLFVKKLLHMIWVKNVTDLHFSMKITIYQIIGTKNIKG
jgi:hypothetical protein